MRRNAFYLIGAQVLVAPLSVITNVLVARYLGPSNFGYLYLATTFATFGFLFVEAGQGAALSGLVAARRQRCGELLGSTLAWRALLLLPVAAVLFTVVEVGGYPRQVVIALALMLVVCTFGTVSNACQDALRGYERTDVGAVTFVAWKLLIALITVPVLLIWHSLPALLLAQALCTAIGAAAMIALLRRVHIIRLQVCREALRELLVSGTPFLLLSLVLALQENVDAVYLSKLASSEAVGWQAAARRLIGLLVYPASALVAALYPTLSRLRYEEPERYASTAASALRTTVLLAVPLACGCLLFSELGVQLFDNKGFAAIRANLQLLAPYLLLVYVSMPLGSVLMSSGRQRAWVLLQLLCVVMSVLLDPWLVPLCQVRFGNGGLGACLSMVTAELLMVAGAVALVPKQLFDRALLRSGAIAVAGGGAMTLTALLFRNITPWVTAPIAVAAYASVLVLCGALSYTGLRQLLQR
ncbi:MAG: oligosaccharide flippase family protein [Steroidobacteraceae bacterium]